MNNENKKVALKASAMIFGGIIKRGDHLTLKQIDKKVIDLAKKFEPYLNGKC